jgi:hypothetical protein
MDLVGRAQPTDVIAECSGETAILNEIGVEAEIAGLHTVASTEWFLISPTTKGEIAA